MKLPPEAVRLRRLARAHAAGELSEAEYRQSRRDLLDRFEAAPDEVRDHFDDSTRPRWDEDITLRGGADGCAAHRASVPLLAPPLPPPSRGGGRRLLWFATLLLAAVAVLLVLPRAASASEVPPVRERTPDPAGSPRLPVTAVLVRWAPGEAEPAQGLPLDRLQARADEALARIRARHTPSAHGFTQMELEELGRLLNALGVHQGDDGLDAADARDLSALIRDQKSRRGISVLELEEVARAVQAQARAEDFFLAAAYLPAQRLDDGVAYIDVLPGRLGDVVVDGSRSGAVDSVFGPLLGQTLTLSEVSSRLQTLDQLAGMDAQASFAPGDRAGESRLRLAVRPERRWHAAATADNHGDEATGRYRLRGDVAVLDLRGAGDRLSAGAMTTADPANQTFAYVGYDLPVAGGYRLSTRVGNHDFSRDGVPELDGGAWFVDLAARRTLVQTRSRSATLIWSGAYQSLDWDAGVDQRVLLAGVGLAGQRVWNESRVAADAVAHLSVGQVSGDRFAGQDRRLWLLEVDAEIWTPADVPGLPGEQKLVARLAGQWTDRALPATRRFSVGGPLRSRAYDRDELLADRGLLLGVEARHPVAVGELLLFGELGYGDRRGSADGWGRVADLGLGWEAALAPGLKHRITVAWPLAVDGTGDIDDDGAKVFWSLRYDH
ncbi:MAG: ShlB/FhaC/HecB family hemolysin secretion/activation protein [Pseudomonadales bacterium]